MKHEAQVQNARVLQEGLQPLGLDERDLALAGRALCRRRLDRQLPGVAAAGDELPQRTPSTGFAIPRREQTRHR